jgi:hypothetical protein
LHTIGFSGDVDNIGYDREAMRVYKRVYIGYGSGALGIVDLATARKLGDIPLDGHPESFQLGAQDQDRDHCTSLARIPTAAGAWTSLFVPNLRRFYLAVPHRGEQAAEVRVYETQP